MANEFKHVSVGADLSQAEWEATAGHVLNSQATGDLIYASSASQLTRLGIGATGTILKVTGGAPAWFAKGTSLQMLRTNSGATDLEWATVSSSAWTSVSSGSFSGVSSINLSGLSGYVRYRLALEAVDIGGVPVSFTLRVNGISGSNDYRTHFIKLSDTTVSGYQSAESQATLLPTNGSGSAYQNMGVLELEVFQNPIGGSNPTRAMAQWQAGAYADNTPQISAIGHVWLSNGGGAMTPITAIMIIFNASMNGQYLFEGSN